ncbi:hypothetical protein [Prosthecobacter algae]|uniref:hypothetical protein n=1 Tax=Prosthecobacter algae TaxID=1144682 RepID=UPI0031EB81C7
MFWREFPSKAAAKIAIQKIINEQPFKQPFESSLISDLILERHYFCSLRGLRPSRFRKIPSYGAYSFEGDFTGWLERDIGWHPVSWTKCLMPPLTEWDRIVRAMRDRCLDAKTFYRDAHFICEGCGIEESAEVHHKQPSFLAIATSIRADVSDVEIADCLSGWDWFVKGDFSLPEGHKITGLFDQRHNLANLEALCKDCHNKTKKRS